MTDFVIAQVLLDNQTIRARSADFCDEWLPAAIQLAAGWGQPPDGKCPEALFARHFAGDRVAIVRVDWPRFHFLILSRALYHHLHDPFAIASRFPANWHARGSLPELAWPSKPLPRRTVAELDEILKKGDGPFLLGASQSLVDGGQIVLERPEPETRMLRDLWALLPDSVRRANWPATYSFSNELGFDLLAIPKIPEGGMPGYLTEEQARDYPDSRYERHLQLAIETGDQPALDKLLARKSTNEMIRLALVIIGMSLGTMAVMRVLTALRVL